jgi:cell division protease FtsH
VVRGVLAENRDKLERLALALLERETLDSDEIHACMKGITLPEKKRVVIPTYTERKEREREKKERRPMFTPAPKPATGDA